MLIGENSYLLVDFSFFTFPLEKDEKMVFNITKKINKNWKRLNKHWMPFSFTNLNIPWEKARQNFLSGQRRKNILFFLFPTDNQEGI